MRDLINFIKQRRNLFNIIVLIIILIGIPVGIYEVGLQQKLKSGAEGEPITFSGPNEGDVFQDPNTHVWYSKSKTITFNFFSNYGLPAAPSASASASSSGSGVCGRFLQQCNGNGTQWCTNDTGGHDTTDLVCPTLSEDARGCFKTETGLEKGCASAVAGTCTGDSECTDDKACLGNTCTSPICNTSVALGVCQNFNYANHQCTIVNKSNGTACRVPGVDDVAGTCNSSGTCVASTAVENTLALCSNNVDDDGDGKIDFADPDCVGVIPAPSTTLEAEYMTHPDSKAAIYTDSIASNGHGLAFASNTTASGKIAGPGDQMIIFAKGELCPNDPNGAPDMTVKIDGTVVGTMKVAAATSGGLYGGYNPTIPTLDGNPHTVEISFVNDLSQPGVCDRNLRVDKIVLNSQAPGTARMNVNVLANPIVVQQAGSTDALTITPTGGANGFTLNNFPIQVNGANYPKIHWVETAAIFAGTTPVNAKITAAADVPVGTYSGTAIVSEQINTNFTKTVSITVQVIAPPPNPTSANCPPYPVGDLNQDCHINATDAQILLNAWDNPSGTGNIEDSYQDNTIDSGDFAVLYSHKE